MGFILTEDHFSIAEPFYTRIFLGTELEARKHNYYVLLTTVNTTVRSTNDLPRFLLEHNVDGVIIAGKIGASWIEAIRERDLPVLLVDYDLPRLNVSTVSTDNRGGARLGVEHLLKLGHTRIGFVGGDFAHPSIAERHRSYIDTLAAAGITPAPNWISMDEDDTRTENGFAGAKKILSNSDGRPTAIFAANDAMAIGCIQYCREAGHSVPSDVAIVGFDNIEAGYHVEPRLTTVNVHREEMGSIAVRRLAEMIEENGDVVTKAITPVELIVRESCGSAAVMSGTRA
jgi:LacI family transcriptional regulator